MAFANKNTLCTITVVTSVLTNGLVEIGPSGARVESGYERGKLSLEHELVVPRTPRARAAAEPAPNRFQSLFLHQ